MKVALTVAVMALVVASCSPGTREAMSPIKVEIIRTETGYQLLRGGEPYEIRGAGMGRDDIARFFEENFALVFPGGKGRLRLTDPQHPLSTGVEIDAQPSDWASVGAEKDASNHARVAGMNC